MDLYDAVMFLLISLPFALTFLAALLNLRCLARAEMPVEFKGLSLWLRHWPTFGDERAIGARLQPATDKMLIAPEATA